jgi:hypothetical protein
MSELSVDKITGKTGTGGSNSPLQFSGDTVTLGTGVDLSSVTIPAAGVTGTLSSSVTLNHDAQKYSWHRYISINVHHDTNQNFNYTSSEYMGSGVTWDASGASRQITIDSNGGGLYLISASIHNHTNTANDHSLHIRVNGTNIVGAHGYANYNTAGSVLYYGPVATLCIPIRLDDDDLVSIYGNGYINGDEETAYFCGVRIGGKT